MYDTYYGLTGRPFQLTPDPQFYFESQTHRKALSYLGYGLAQGEGFIVITGEVGAGKTTLVGHLMQTIDKARLTAAQIVTTQVSSGELLHLVARSFGLQTSGMDKAAVLKMIEQFLHSEARAGRRCLLVVDESQNLPIQSIEELRMLSNFQLGSQALLQIFLLGQPEFRDMVQSAPELEQLRQRVIATHHLSAMEPTEIRPYIEHRLAKVNWSGQPSFADDAVQNIYAATGGIPRKVNTLVNRVLLMGAVEQLGSIEGELVSSVLSDMGSDSGKASEASPSEPAKAEVQEQGRTPEPARHEMVAQPVAEKPQPAEMRAPEVMPEPEDMIAPLSSPSMQNAKLQDYGDVASAPQHHFENNVPSQPDQNTSESHAESFKTSGMSEEDHKMILARLDDLENCAVEQERVLRRTLTMLVEWVENDGASQDMLQDRAA